MYFKKITDTTEQVPVLELEEYIISGTLYFVPWLILPWVSLGVFPISTNTISLMGLFSIILLVLSFLVFGKWILFSKVFTEKGEGNGGNSLPWVGSLWTLIIIMISYFVYCWLLESEKDFNVFDKATLWSAVYGTIFGTFSYLRVN